MLIDEISKTISEFSIVKLHGERNVTISFDSAVKILVAENGTGKTTILNTLFALISGNYAKLSQISFESISLKFFSGSHIQLSKKDIVPRFDHVQNSGMLNHFRTFLSDFDIGNLYEEYKTTSREKFKQSLHFSLANDEMKKRHGPHFPDDALSSWMDALAHEIANHDVFPHKLHEAREIISKEIPFEIIYLPTYRRIEEDLANITNSQVTIDLNKTMIQFGMKDVEANFTRITSEIIDSSIKWFAKINGQMLGSLIKGFEFTSDMQLRLDDHEALKIVLQRIGNNMPENDKELILSLIQSKEILQDKYKNLAYFLSNLVNVYEQQKENDNAIKKFADICNKYLVGKKIFYDESAVTISIKRTKNHDEVLINSLSSGEKQIISLFSRLFLSKSQQVAIFFDEPELSLSIEWQKQLLPDILDSGICAFLFCTTHSPFIFDNQLADYTSGLNLYIEEL